MQRLGLALTALGVGETFASRGLGYGAALAQPARRKLAVLVGINAYSESTVDTAAALDTALAGALNDVEMQRQLLIHRFGFRPADIITLTDQQATSQEISEAIGEYLTQAKAGDTALFHFSGYGSQVRLAGGSGRLVRSLVPVDGRLPTEDNPVISDLLESQLYSQLRRLNTEQLVTVLDAGYRDLGQLEWGTLRLRSRPTIPTGVAPEGSQAAEPRSKEPWPGLLLRASSLDRLVLEKNWSDFSAGVFTYALTQTLWEALPPTSIQVVLRRTEGTLRRWTGPDQTPEAAGTRTAGPITELLPTTQGIADAVVTRVDNAGQTARLWLGGLPAAVLEQLQPNSRFYLAALNGEGGLVTLKSRSKLEAQVSTGSLAPQVGQRAYEQVRLYTRDVDLVVALDPHLERIERVDATSALSSIPFVSFTVSRSQPADCLFGRLPQLENNTLTAALPQAAGFLTEAEGAERSYGLFSPNRTLIPGTLIDRDEAVKTAVNRLAPYFQSLLAMKLVRLTSNQQSSQLAVRAILESTRPQERLLMQRETLRSQVPLPKSQLPQLVRADMQDLDLSPETRLRYRLHNYSQRPVYFTLLSFDSRGQFRGLVPNIPSSWEPQQIETALSDALISPEQSQVLPANTMDWGISAAAIWVETFVIASTAPLQRTWKALRGEQETPLQPGLRELSQPLRVARTLLEDLHQAAVAQQPDLQSSETYALATDTWVTFSFRYGVAQRSL